MPQPVLKWATDSHVRIPPEPPCGGFVHAQKRNFTASCITRGAFAMLLTTMDDP